MTDNNDQKFDKPTKVVEPNYTIKSKIGQESDMRRLINDDKIIEAEIALRENINLAKKDFVQNAKNIIQELELALKGIVSNQSPEQNLEKINVKSLELKSQALLFKYSAMAAISEALYAKYSKKPADDDCINKITICIETLQIIIKEDISDDKSDISRNLLADKLFENFEKKTV